jgi:hypothetical protein
VSGVEKRQWLMQDCDFDPLRNDPRFDEILAQAEGSSLTA